MKRTTIVFAMIVFVAGQAFAQPDPEIEWMRTYGGSANEELFDAVALPDGGFAMGGGTSSFGQGLRDYYLVRTNHDGDTLWTRTYGGADEEEMHALAVTADQGFLLAGISLTYGSGNGDMWIVRTDPDGNVIWTRTVGGSGIEAVYSIAPLSDNRYIIAGITNSLSSDFDIFLVLMNDLGDTLWTRSFDTGQSANDVPNAIQQSSDGGFFVAGYTYVSGHSMEAFLIKVSGEGAPVWTQLYGGANEDAFEAIELPDSEHILLTGFTQSFGNGSDDFYVVLADSAGNALWTQTYGGQASDRATCSFLTDDGNFLAAGYLDWSGIGDFYLVKADLNTGDTLWTRTYGGAAREVCLSVLSNGDCGYFLAGNTESFGTGGNDFWAVQTGPDVFTGLDAVTLSNGEINGLPITNSILELNVLPGAPLSGTLSLSVFNTLPPTSVAPLAMVWNWGPHDSSHSLVHTWLPQGQSIQQATVSLTAPSIPGVYYVTFATSGEFNSAQIASLTNWSVAQPHWNDGADIADWGADEYEQSVSHHAVSTQYEAAHGYYCRWVGAAMAKITVLECPELPEDPDMIILSSGDLNGISVDNGVLDLYVMPGSALSGTLSLNAYNTLPPTSVAPLAMVWNWGAHDQSHSLVHPWLPQGQSAQQVDVSLTAPAIPGVYYITFATSGEYNSAQIASLTNWSVAQPHWNDGADIANWQEAEYQSALANHAVRTIYEGVQGYYCRWLGAAMIRITVLECPDLSNPADQVELAGGSLNGESPSGGILELDVVPGGLISGTLTLDIYNTLPPTSVAPLALVWNWGLHDTSHSLIHPWLPHGQSTQQATVSRIAPTEPGVYYITFATSGEFNSAQIASLTNWSVSEPHWYDAVDIADWSSEEYQLSIAHHAVQSGYEAAHGYYCRWLGAAMIKITVLNCYDYPPAAPQIVLTTQGGDAHISWSPVTESLPGCAIAVNAYLVYYSPGSVGPFYFHGYTSDTTYTHHGVVQFASGMYYEVEAYIGPISKLGLLPRDGEGALLSPVQVRDLLRE
jgi:hypothetical protein